MTMIMAVNLSHKLIIAGDTRVTSRQEGLSEPIYIDNICKVLPLWSKQNPNQAFYNKDSLALAVAGDLQFCSYIYIKIKRALETKELDSDIRKLSEQILDFIKKESDAWLYEKPFSHCALIISGITPRRNKKISLEKLRELEIVFKARRDEHRPMRDKSLNEALKKDPIMIEIDRRIKESGRATGGVIEMLKEGDEPVLSSWIIDAIENESEEIDMPDSLLVGVEIDHRRGIANLETAEWGEMLGYGAALSKEELDTSLISAFELTHVKEDAQHKHDPSIFEATFMRQVILDYAKKKNLSVIGGDVPVFFLNKNGEFNIRAPGLTVDPITGKMFMTIRGHKLPISTFYELAKFRAKNEKLEL
ncbi:hypothetical protein K2Q08_01230 [Patescibacteria group bacterium]|nr:hypothetical protein [Patescibacteria group bacterium]